MTVIGETYVCPDCGETFGLKDSAIDILDLILCMGHSKSYLSDRFGVSWHIINRWLNGSISNKDALYVINTYKGYS